MYVLLFHVCYIRPRSARFACAAYVTHGDPESSMSRDIFSLSYAYTILLNYFLGSFVSWFFLRICLRIQFFGVSNCQRGGKKHWFMENWNCVVKIFVATVVKIFLWKSWKICLENFIRTFLEIFRNSLSLFKSSRLCADWLCQFFLLYKLREVVKKPEFCVVLLIFSLVLIAGFFRENTIPFLENRGFLG